MVVHLWSTLLSLAMHMTGGSTWHIVRGNFLYIRNSSIKETSIKKSSIKKLTDFLFWAGIYPKWATLVQSITQPQGQMKKHFAQMQEAARNDVERCFGVLQAQFAIVNGPAGPSKKNHLHLIMTTCIILHKKMIEDEKGLHLNSNDVSAMPYSITAGPLPDDASMNAFLRRYEDIQSSEHYFQL